MKVCITSDLHLVFAPLKIENAEQAKVLILGGDICELAILQQRDTKLSKRFFDFFADCASEFEHVLYVAGNHEFYKSDFATGIDDLRLIVEQFPNICLLEDQAVTIEDTLFIGATLWTDMNNEDPASLFHVKHMMNDYYAIKNSDSGVTYRDSEGTFHTRSALLTPQNTVYRHKKSLEYIKHVLANNAERKCVVLTHHAPSYLSIHEQYAYDTLMNSAFASDLSQFILDHPQIALWTHGHTHSSFDYTIGSTRVVCNPRGYAGHELQASNFKPLYLEI
jgi:Icc-related predicted phosphoesterase